MFRTVEDGTPIDFVLQNAIAADGATAAVQRAARARPSAGND
jgi:hypothetical protein